MGEMAPSLRDDFPMNAFALLPVSVTDGSASEQEQVPVAPGVSSAVEVLKSEALEDESVENPIVLLKFNLAHTEFRETIETLYGAVESLEHERVTLKRENAELRESIERVKVDAVKEVEQVREQLHARDYEVTQAHQKTRELEKHKEHLSSEISELQLKLSERDATIDSLKATVQELQNEHEAVRDVARRDAELRRLSELWASKERSVAENTDHVHQATTDVQRLTKQLQSQLKQVEGELVATEKASFFPTQDIAFLSSRSCGQEYSTLRSYISEHKCALGTSNMDHQQHHDLNSQELQQMRKRVAEAEHAKLETSTENQVLRTKCKEYMNSIRLLSSKMEQVQENAQATNELVIKYQESTEDGTQTIAELQESLVKLCDQLAGERKEHTERMGEQMRKALDSETGLREEMKSLRGQLEAVLQDVENLQSTREATVGKCRRCDQSQLSSPSRGCATTILQVDQVDHNPASGFSSPPPLPRPRVDTPKQPRIAAQESTSIEEPPVRISIKDKLEVASTTEKRRVGDKRDRNESLQLNTSGQQVSCQLCNEEAFGFMVRCQKCKDPFHAGCVKKSGTGAKKRLGHIFKCTKCAPHRPNKVARHGDEDTNNSTLSDISRTKAIPLQVTPSRTGGVIGRPPPPS